jgi:hypothetical protein
MIDYKNIAYVLLFCSVMTLVLFFSGASITGPSYDPLAIHHPDFSVNGLMRKIDIRNYDTIPDDSDNWNESYLLSTRGLFFKNLLLEGGDTPYYMNGSEENIQVDAFLWDIEIYLPLADDPNVWDVERNAGKIIMIKKIIGDNWVYLYPTGDAFLDGEDEFIITFLNTNVMLYTNGSDWFLK